VIDKLPPRPKRRNLPGQVSHTPTFGKAKTFKLDLEERNLERPSLSNVEEVKEETVDQIVDPPGLPRTPVNLKSLGKRMTTKSRSRRALGPAVGLTTDD